MSRQTMSAVVRIHRHSLDDMDPEFGAKDVRQQCVDIQRSAAAAAVASITTNTLLVHHSKQLLAGASNQLEVMYWPLR